MKRLTLLTLLLLTAAARADSPATAPFTPGPDTTLIIGPLLPDGTLDYVPAINALWAKGVTAENNAVPLLKLALLPPKPDWDETDRLFAALNIPPPARTTQGAIPRSLLLPEPPGRSPLRRKSRGRSLPPHAPLGGRRPSACGQVARRLHRRFQAARTGRRLPTLVLPLHPETRHHRLAGRHAPRRLVTHAG